MQKVIDKKAKSRNLFLFFCLLSFILPLMLSFIPGHGSFSFYELLPGLYKWVKNSENPLGRFLSVSCALIFSLISAFTIASSIEIKTGLRNDTKNRTFLEKILYALFGFILIISPWTLGDDVERTHQLSYGFFSFVEKSDLAFSLMNFGIYAYTTSILVFICALFKEKR